MLFETGSLLTAAAALAVVLGLVWAGGRAARLSGLAARAPGPRMLALRDAIALDSRRRLLVVRCGARDLVVLTGGATDVVVGWLDQPDLSAATGSLAAAPVPRGPPSAPGPPA